MQEVTADDVAGLTASVTVRDLVRIFRTTLDQCETAEERSVLNRLLQVTLMDQGLGKRLRAELGGEIPTMTVKELVVVRNALASKRAAEGRGSEKKSDETR
jgi:hypothetical protein